MTAIAEAVLAAVEELGPGPLVVALSGGPDSAVAAWACSETMAPGSVRSVFVDHGWEASARLGKAAQAIADRLGLPLQTIPVEVAPGPSREGSARIARLEALEAVADGTTIVTGHHADDAAETVLGNLVRGAGITGLAGIPSVRPPFVRPLLNIRRSDLRRLAKALELPFTDDPANQDLSLRRNLLRHRVLPELSRQLGEDVVSPLVRAARQLEATDAFLDSVTPDVPVVHDEGAYLIPIAPLVTLDRVVVSRLVRATLRHLNPPYAGTSREVEAVLALSRRERSRADLVGGFVAVTEGAYVALYRPDAAEAPSPVALRIPGVTQFGSHFLMAGQVDHGTKHHLSHDRVRLLLPGEVMVRAPREGDRIELSSGRKTVADALGEAGIPRRKRRAWPVVESHGRIAWVAGVRAAAWARDEASRGTWIELERRTS